MRNLNGRSGNLGARLAALEAQAAAAADEDVLADGRRMGVAMKQLTDDELEDVIRAFQKADGPGAGPDLAQMTDAELEGVVMAPTVAAGRWRLVFDPAWAAAHLTPRERYATQRLAKLIISGDS